MESFDFTKHKFKIITGKQLKELKGSSDEQQLVKLTNKSCQHRSIKYKNGVIVDSAEWRPYGSCCFGGIYICFKKDIREFLSYDSKIGVMEYTWDVEIDDDEEVYVEENKFKIHKLKISNKKRIWDDMELFEQIVNGNINGWSGCDSALEHARNICKNVQECNPKPFIDHALKNPSFIKCISEKIHSTLFKFSQF